MYCHHTKDNWNSLLILRARLVHVFITLKWFTDAPYKAGTCIHYIRLYQSSSHDSDAPYKAGMCVKDY